MRELGGVEPVTLIDSVFVAGHPIAKSGNSAYRLNTDFKIVLKASNAQLDRKFAAWASQDAVRKRREYQAKVEEEARKQVASGHSQLISDSVEHYAKRFLPGYEVVYVDDGDGDRITDEDRKKLASAGITLQLGDAVPDVLLWNPKTDRLWVIEAVTSDGEVDFHKVDQMKKMAERCGKNGIDFTTTYRNWRDAAVRQEKNKKPGPWYLRLDSVGCWETVPRQVV